MASETKVDILRTAIQSGINFIDNAEVYGAFPGESESIMGQAGDNMLWIRFKTVLTLQEVNSRVDQYPKWI